MLRVAEGYDGAHIAFDLFVAVSSKPKRSIVNTKFLCSLAVASMFAFGGAASALAAPAGPEGPANCSFTGGTTKIGRAHV